MLAIILNLVLDRDRGARPQLFDVLTCLLLLVACGVSRLWIARCSGIGVEKLLLQVSGRLKSTQSLVD